MSVPKIISSITSFFGSTPVVIFSVLLVVLWLLGGLIVGFTDSYQLIINTTTTVVTYVMVFVIQNSQNRDARAIETKLDALIEALEQAPNKIVGLEEESEKNIKKIQEEIRSES